MSAPNEGFSLTADSRASFAGAARARLREEPMRAIFATAILLFCLSTVAPEPDYLSLLPGAFHLGGGKSIASLVQIESSRARGSRKAIGAQLAAKTSAQNPAPPAQPAPAQPPAASANASAGALPNVSEPGSTPQASVDDLCNALLTSAQDNDLPVAFFANLIWQESRLRDDAVSPKGAMGIAQFMPKVAMASGLENPFDPLSALAASARLLGELRDQFGNLGFVAAAYNAGAKRVSEWLARRRALPRETRVYVMDVTGRSVEQWQKSPQNTVELHFVRRLPCRDMPAFSQLEQAQLQQAQSARQQAQEAKAEQPQTPKPPEKVAAKRRATRQRGAEHKPKRTPLRHEDARTAEREHHRAAREAKQHIRRAPRARPRRA